MEPKATKNGKAVDALKHCENDAHCALGVALHRFQQINLDSACLVSCRWRIWVAGLGGVDPAAFWFTAAILEGESQVARGNQVQGDTEKR